MVANLAGDPSGESTPPTLHADVSGEGPPVMLLHGLFGMGSNLGSLARALAPTCRVHQLDLPSHGRSEWTSDMSLPALAAAVEAYRASTVDSPVWVVGHSLGGKVAMQMAMTFPEAVAGVVIADIAPVDYPPSHDAVFAAIAAVEADPPPSRAAGGEMLRDHLREEGVAQFLQLSLHRSADGSYVWRFNASALRSNHAAMRAAPEGGPYAGDALFISGAESAYVGEEGRQAAKRLFPNACFVELAGTGHWLHAEKPREFNQQVLDFLQAHGAMG